MKSSIRVSVKSTDNTISSGSVAQKDLKRDGYIGVTFTISGETIGAEIAGFSCSLVYRYNPINDREKNINRCFIQRYVDKCQNPESIKNQLGINF